MFENLVIPKFGEQPLPLPSARYGTKAELIYLRHLGSWSDKTRGTRAELLRRYLQACSARARWDGIDAAQVIKWAAILLRTEEKGKAVPFT